MMVRVNGEYLDFNDAIEVESQIKLFEEISTSNGDYSYSFELAKTNKNLKALGLPFPDTIKSIYNNVRCDLIDDSGFKVHTGSLQVNNITDVIQCSFFGGNNDWFGLLSDPLNSLPLYKYDITLTPTNIQASWSQTQGLVFPIIDAGALISRSYHTLKTEDFTPLFYVKTLFNEIFNPLGIKLQGDLLQDINFNMLTVASNAKSQSEVSNRSSYVQKTTQQSGITTTPVKITFQNETTFPYFDGSQGNFTNSTYTADVKMTVQVDITFAIFLNANVGSTKARIHFYKNGVSFSSYTTESSLIDLDINTTKTISIQLETGDTIEIYAEESVGNGSIDVESGSIKITPTYIYKSFGVSSVPNWSKGEFVSNILRIFNVLPSFNSDSKTLTLDLFNKIKQKEAVDVSDQININTTDFSEFVSSYGKNNFFNYQEGSDEDLREYNISNFVSYGSGLLTVNNDFINNESDVIDTDFTSPITYINGAFDMSMERINFVELEDIDEKEITSVTDSGDARFNISNANDLFTDGDLVRIETDVDGYNGEWVVSAVTSTYIELTGVNFDTNGSGTATLVRHKFTTDDSVYIFINVPNVSNLFFSTHQGMRINDDLGFQTSSVAYFNLLSTGRGINTKYKQSLSFGAPNNPLNYQMTMLDTYWPIFSAILNDPVMLIVAAYFNKKTYSELKSFLRPLRIKTNQTNNLYYLNRITGYQSGHEPCEAELIKL